MTNSEKLKILHESRRDAEKDLNELKHRAKKIQSKIFVQEYYFESLKRIILELEESEEKEFQNRNQPDTQTAV